MKIGTVVGEGKRQGMGNCFKIGSEYHQSYKSIFLKSAKTTFKTSGGWGGVGGLR